jgi:hypothetical protein
MDDVPIVDDVPMPSLAVAAAAAQGQCPALADEAFQAVVVQPHPQAEADQARGHRVEHLTWAVLGQVFISSAHQEVSSGEYPNGVQV